MTLRRLHQRKPDTNERDALLEGEEAMLLYAAEMERQIAVLGQQVDLLKAAFAERKQLLKEI